MDLDLEELETTVRQAIAEVGGSSLDEGHSSNPDSDSNSSDSRDSDSSENTSDGRT